MPEWAPSPLSDDRGRVFGAPKSDAMSLLMRMVILACFGLDSRFTRGAGSGVDPFFVGVAVDGDLRHLWAFCIALGHTGRRHRGAV